jgi:hypothetical protein
MGAFLRRTVPLCCALLAALASAGAPSATAATPCGEAVILDWSDGTLDRVYSVACYRDALARLPEDLRAYSTAPEDIERALLERARADAPSAPRKAPASSEAPAAQAEEAPRSLAGPTRTPTTTEEEAAPAAGPDAQPPAGSDAMGDAMAAPVTAEPAASTRAPAVMIAALVLLAAGAAIPLVRALAGRRRGA